MTPIEIILFLLVVGAASGAVGTGAWTALGKGPQATANRAALRAGAGAGFSAAAGTARDRYSARRQRRSARQRAWRAWWNETLSWGWFKPGPWLNSFADAVQGLIRDSGAVVWSGARAGGAAARTARRNALAAGRGAPAVQPEHPMVCVFCHTDLVDAMCPRCSAAAIRTASDPDTDWDAERADTAETRRRNDIQIARRRGLYGVPNSPGPNPTGPSPADQPNQEDPMASVANIEILTVDDLEQVLRAIRDAAVTLSETNFTEMAAAARRLPEDVQAAPFDPGDVVNRAIGDLAEAAPDPKTFESMFEAADAAMQALKVLDGLREDASDVAGVQGEVRSFAAS